jgi:hypothetical protein
MGHEHSEVNIAGKFSAIEEAILDCLYDHPDDATIGTTRLASLVKPEDVAEQPLTLEKIQYGIETLIAARLVKGNRVRESDKVQYVKLRLTAKGQAESIKQRRRRSPR